MLREPCKDCPGANDCLEHGTCLMLLIAYASGGDEQDFGGLNIPQTDYTDEANITETVLPHIDANALDYEDLTEEG